MLVALKASQVVTPARPSIGRLRPLSLQDVRLVGGLWGGLQQLNSEAVIPHSAGWIERIGWLANIEQAAAWVEGAYRGWPFADSEIYKIIEAISWESARGVDSAQSILDAWIPKIQALQEPDGYLHSKFGRPWQAPRYSDFAWGHELYSFGHFIQAAVAHHRATATTVLLDMAQRLADHVCVMFAEDGLRKLCGHPGIEMALVELYRETGERRYLQQASVFVERRGTGTLPLHAFGRAYWQEDQRVRDAQVLRGHAVRALYLSCGAVDVALETGDSDLMSALEGQWERTVARRTYITGGMGSHHMDEAFGEDFVLPPDRAYCETCAGVASIMFSWRLLLATGRPRYADLIERTLYNIVATSPSADGRSFFYANSLHQRDAAQEPSRNDDGVTIRGGSAGRQPWFEVSCCPPNLARTLASVAGLAATDTLTGVQVHQYMAGRIASSGRVLRVETDYPDSGRIQITVDASDGLFDLSLRIPSWAHGAAIIRSGKQLPTPQPGTYAVVAQVGQGESVQLDLPMEPRFVFPDDRIDAVRGTVAVERGPDVLAIESVDLPTGWEIADVVVDQSVGLVTDGDGATVTVRHRDRSVDRQWPYGRDEPSGGSQAQSVVLHPYRDWAKRGPSTMRIWLPLEPVRGSGRE
jgi:DUF1680 family protein